MEKQFPQNKYLGMTVNDRLFHAGLLDDFDKSIEEQDKTKLVLILEKVFLSRENIEAIIEKYTKD
jgi:hypothetical protein